MRTNPEFMARDIAGELVLVPVGSAAKENQGLITCNELGAFIWHKLEQETTLEDLVQEILKEYEVEEATARADAEEFLAKLKEKKAIL